MSSKASRQTARVPVSPTLLRWARRRAGVESGAVAKRFPKFAEWERGETQPTLRQVEDFARFTRAAVGYLFLSEPPEETVPIPDFRTVADRPLRRPSPDLLDTIYLCQERQHWYREYAAVSGEAACRLVGMFRRSDDPVAAAARLREALRYDLEERAEGPARPEAFRRFRARCEDAGVLVMTSGIVGGDTRRKLDPDEFRGFALSDPLAPLVFVNAADESAAQVFTLAHEMARIALDETALSDTSPEHEPAHATERWCNRVAAEFLVPLAAVRAAYDARATPVDRVGHRFARALVESTLEGRSTSSEAFRLLGIRRAATFRKVVDEIRLGERAFLSAKKPRPSIAAARSGPVNRRGECGRGRRRGGAVSTTGAGRRVPRGGG